MCAAAEGYGGIAHLLLDQGARMDLPNGNVTSSLAYVAVEGQDKITYFLFDQGVRINTLG